MSTPAGPLPRRSSTTTLSRRQACDRCYEQKVRCIREDPADETVGEAVGQARCLRCRKAGATCVYSYSQRTGRPPTKRNPSDPRGEKQPKKSQRSSKSSSPVQSSSASSLPSTEALQTMMLAEEPEPGVGAFMETDLDHFMSDVIPTDAGEFHPETGYDTNYEQYMAEFGMDGVDLWSGIPSLSTGSTPPSVEHALEHALEHAQMNNSAAASGTGTGTCTMTSDLGWSEYDFHSGDAAPLDSTEAYIEQLTELNRSIFRSTRAMSTTPGPSPTTGAWPISGEIFEATSSLIKVIDSFSHAQTAAGAAAVGPALHYDMSGEFEHFAIDPSTVFPPPASSPVPRHFPDPGVSFLILAAHQRLLDAFESMCHCIHRQLRAMKNGHQHHQHHHRHHHSHSHSHHHERHRHQRHQQQQQQQQPSGHYSGQMLLLPLASADGSSATAATPYGGQTFAPSSTAQFAVVVELITYYLDRLDRALGPAADVQDACLAAAMFEPAHSSSSESLSSLGFGEGLGLAAAGYPQTGDRKQGFGRAAEEQQMSNGCRAAMKVGQEMQQRYQKLREQMRVIKGLIRASDEC